MKKDVNFVTVKSFMFPTEAYPLMAKLESEGIKCFLDNENTVSVLPFYSNAVGGVKLNIRDSDLKKAMVIINEMDNFFKKERTHDAEKYASFQKDYVEVDTYCPKCESVHIYRKKFPLFKTLISILLFPIGIYFLFITKKHYCADCGNVWNQ